MAELFKVNAPVRKPLFEGVQGENEARSIQFDVTPWVEELGDGAVTATAKRSQDSQPYPVTVTKVGTIVTWKPTSTDTAFAGVGSFQLEYTVDDVLAKTCIWSTMVAPSLDPAGDPPDPYDNWLAEMRQVAADALQSAQDAEQAAEDAQDEVENAEAWAVGQRGGVDVPSTDPAYENNAKYWAEQSLANQYGAFIVKSASGDIASFSDGADDVPMKSVKVAIVPKQSGSGDPSPSNVRPITGTSTANVFVMGKNMLDTSAYHDSSKTTNGITFTINADGTIRATGTATATASFLVVYDDQKLPLGTYYVAGCPSSGSATAYRMSFSSWAGYSNVYENGNGAIWNHGVDERIRVTLMVYAGNTVDIVFKPIISKTPVTYADYEPYTGHTTPVPLGQTVYGGTVNPISGELTITHAMVDMGSLSWLYRNQRFDAVLALGAKILITSGGTPSICSIYPHDTHNYAGMADKSFICGSGYVSGGTCSLIVYDSTYGTDANAFKTAMNGVQLCYQLATPTTVQLTPAQVATLLGTNNVWSDAGAVEVEYRADPTLAYNELANVIVSLGGNL